MPLYAYSQEAMGQWGAQWILLISARHRKLEASLGSCLSLPPDPGLVVLIIRGVPVGEMQAEARVACGALQ